MKTQNLILPALAAILAAGCHSPIPIPAQPIAVPTQPLPQASLDAVPQPNTIFGTETRVAPTTPAPNKARALLVVQRHGGTQDTELSLQQLGDWLASALGAGAFSVVNPHDVIGTVQNVGPYGEQDVGPWGERMPEASATALAEKIGTPVLLTASVTDVRLRHIGGTDPGVQAIFEFTLSAKAVPGGDLLASVNVATRSRKVPGMAAFKLNSANYWSEVAKEGAYKAAPALCQEWEKSGLVPPSAPAPVSAVFAANVKGAVLRIDGVAYGTFGDEPFTLSLSPGLHNVEIAYPEYVAFRELAMIQEGSSFGVVLLLNDEGRAEYWRDTSFRRHCDRIKKYGFTESLVKAIVANGYDKYFEVGQTEKPEDVFRPFIPDELAREGYPLLDDEE